VIINTYLQGDKKVNTKGKFNENRGFGVEIEFIRPSNVSKQDICDALTVGCEVEGYNHITRPHWKIVTDCSVHSNDSQARRGLVGDNEIVSPILYGADGFAQLSVILETLNEVGCEVNYTCGIHVHHDVTNKMVEGKKQGEKFLANLIKFVAKYEHLIYKLVSPSRLDSRRYSTPVRQEFFRFGNVTKNNVAKMVSKVKEDCNRKYGSANDTSIDRGQTYPYAQDNRACGLNFRNVWTRGSVEFRYHNGSLNFEKIVSWIVLTQAIVNTVEDTNSVQMNYVPNDVDRGFWRFRKAIGFVVCDTDEVTKKASSYSLKRFKELSNREADYIVNRQYAYVQDGLTTNQVEA